MAECAPLPCWAEPVAAAAAASVPTAQGSRTKKHSGPRKRRAKKKPEPSVQAACEPEEPLAASDDIDALLQRELTLAAAHLGEEDEDDGSVIARQAEKQPPRESDAFAFDAFYDQQQQQMTSAASLPPEPADGAQPHDRAFWTEWVIEAAEKERARRLNVLRQLQREEEEEVKRRRKWAIAAIEREQEAMMREMFLDNMKNTQWFQNTISRFAEDYEVVCPNSWFGCTFSCMLKDLERHLESCVYRQVPDTLDQAGEDSLAVDFYSYDVVCPNAVLGCKEICSRENLAAHLAACPVNGISREKEWEERLEGRRNVLRATEEERARRMSEQQKQNSSEEESVLSFSHLQLLYEEQTAMMQVVLHDEIVDFCEHEEVEAQRLRPWINQAVAKVKLAIQELWGPQILVEGYGSFATRLHGGHSDVDLVVFGVAEDTGLSCQQCVSALAAHFAGSSHKSDFVEISAITKASIPLLKIVVLVSTNGSSSDALVSDGGVVKTNGDVAGNEKVLRVPFDITFDDPRGALHNGVASAALVSTLVDHFYGLRELALVLKYFLVKRGVNDPYVGGLSSYGLLLMIIFILQEQGALVSALADGEVLDPAETVTGATATRLQAESNERADRVATRFEHQRQKGRRVAREIIDQSLARLQSKPDSSTSGKAAKKKTRRPHLPSLLANEDESEHGAKPYLLGKYLMDFLQFYGNDFRQQVDTIMVSGLLDERDSGAIAAPSPPSSGRSSMVSPSASIQLSPGPPAALHSPPPPISCPPPPLLSRSPSMSPASPPPLSHEGLLVIRDPLQAENNVGKSCYRVSQVCRDFSDFLSFLTALIVRGSVMTTVKKKRKKADSVSCGDPDQAGLLPPPSSEPSSPSARAASHRILTSVFEMKTRDTRASVDLSS